MPKFRYAVLENDKALGPTVTSGTETIDLPEAGLLSELTLLWRNARTYTDQPVLPFYLQLKKLEVLVDGSTVVKSLDGRQAKAIEWYNKGPFGQGDGYGGGGNSNKAYYPTTLYFGYEANDTKNALKLEDYANPQMKITYDLTSGAFDGITYDTTTTPTITYNLMAKLIDGAPAGFTNRYCQSREIDSYNPSASGYTNTEIPRGYDLKGVMLGTRYTDKAWYSGMNHVKLDFDNGKWLPVDMDYENLVTAMRAWHPHECEWGGAVNLANSDPFDLRVLQADSLGNSPIGVVQNEIVRDGWEFPLFAAQITGYDGAAITDRYAHYVSVRGFGPMQTIYIPMEQLLDGSADTIRTTDYGRIDFKVETSGYSASAITHVVGEYMKPNGQ